MKHVFFFVSFFMQLSTGFPILPLFLFWQAIVSSFGEIIFWSLLTGVSFWVTLGSPLYWTTIAIVGSLFVLSIRTHLLRLTPFSISLLLFLVISVWYGGAFLASLFPPFNMIKLFFAYSSVFFIFYAICFEKKAHIQRRLF